MLIYLVVRGLIEKSDSIGYDLTFQYRLFRQWSLPVRVFAGQYRQELYPDIPIETIERLAPAMREQLAPVVYHWCDGWSDIDDWLTTLSSPVIIRWHNNTPPWFFAPYSVEPTARTIRGFKSLLRIAEAAPIKFWVNSEFTGRQLEILGIPDERIHVVYPASHYIEHESHFKIVAKPGRVDYSDPIRLLFAGRVVPHKGHRHVILSAYILQRWLGRTVEVHFPGRPDPSMSGYLQELRSLANDLQVTVNFPGEVALSELNRLYQTAHVFVGLSEHEGFGLPVIEAMQMGLPVVGYRIAAVADLLADHPLACDRLDYFEIARKLAVAIQPDPVHSAIVNLQSSVILPRFTRQVIESQLAWALGKENLVYELQNRQFEPGVTDIMDSAELLKTIHENLKQWENTPIPAMSLPFSYKDYPNHYVTAYDVQAFDKLLRGQEKNPEETDLRDEAMRITFRSARPVIGHWINSLKKAMLILQDGLVTTIAKANTRMDKKLSILDGKLERVIQELVKQKNSMSIDLGQEDKEAAIRAVSAIYDETYFEGQKTRSNYESYSRTARIPNEELAQTLWELFRPKSFLEVGCALGFVVKAMRGYGVEAYGIDVSEWAVKQAGVPYIMQSDISRQPISGQFDIVIAFDVLEHIPESRLAYAIKNLWQATRRYLIVVPAYYEEGTSFDPSEPTHVVFHPKPWWEHLFRSCGVSLDVTMAETLSRTVHAQSYSYAGRYIVGVRHHDYKEKQKQ